MLKPKELYIIIYVNVSVKRVYPHKTNYNVLVCYGKKIQKINLPSHDRVCDDRSLIVLSTKVSNLPSENLNFHENVDATAQSK